MDHVTITVIGAGVVGLAVAAELARRHGDVLVLERHESFGRETSSRNSEVIHSGLYYPQGSLKASLCVEGSRRLYELCRNHAIAHKRIGKLVVAVDSSEMADLEAIFKNGCANGAEGLRLIDGRELARMEPGAAGVAALHVPNTGIVDSHGLMSHLHIAAMERGAVFAFKSDVELIEKGQGGFMMGVRQEGYRFFSRIVINCAGLNADRMAGLAGIDIDGAGYRLAYCKGSYFHYAGRSPVGRLVYPVPHKDLRGLGVHATLDLGNRLRFGPDAEYVDSLDYSVDENKRDAFFESARRIVPGIERESLFPDMAGIRPKLRSEDGRARDFVVAEESMRGLPGLIDLVGIESPGLTSCLAIAEMVGGMVDELLK